ncbi:hypothetical protein LDENG_00276230, partial [Lucifuga dentata]
MYSLCPELRMHHLKNEPSFKSLLVRLILLLVVQTRCCGGNDIRTSGIQVTGPQKVVAALGDDVVLPCHLEPPVDAVSMTLEWARPDLAPRFVFVWHNRQELLINKHPSYGGRTSMSIEELKHGNISLKISNVTLSDEGTYRCYLPKQETQTNVKLAVGSVSSPVVSLAGITESLSGVVLACDANGWYPEPEVFWLDGEGRVLSAGHPETLRGPDGLYAVSSRVTVEKIHSNTFTCSLRQNNINQTRETHVHVQDGFLPVSCTAATHLTVSLVACFAFSFVVFFFVWKWRQNKIKKVKTEMSRLKELEQKEKLIDEREKIKDLNKKLTNITEQLQKTEEDVIKTLTEQVNGLKTLRDGLSVHKKEMDELIDENQTKAESVEKEIKEMKGDQTAMKAQGYFRLKGITVETRGRITESMNKHQNLQLKTEMLLESTQRMISGIKEKKKEVE